MQFWYFKSYNFIERQLYHNIDCSVMLQKVIFGRKNAILIVGHKNTTTQISIFDDMKNYWTPTFLLLKIANIRPYSLVINRLYW